MEDKREFCRKGRFILLEESFTMLEIYNSCLMPNEMPKRAIYTTLPKEWTARINSIQWLRFSV